MSINVSHAVGKILHMKKIAKYSCGKKASIPKAKVGCTYPAQIEKAQKKFLIPFILRFYRKRCMKTGQRQFLLTAKVKQKF